MTELLPADYQGNRARYWRVPATSKGYWIVVGYHGRGVDLSPPDPDKAPPMDFIADPQLMIRALTAADAYVKGETP